MKPRSRALSVVLLFFAAFFAPAAGGNDLAVATELGITPESLVVAGFSTTDAQTILTRIENAATEKAALAVSHQDLTDRLAELAAFQVALRDDPDNTDIRSDCEAAAAAVASARETVGAGQGALFELAMDEFTAGNVQSVRDFQNSASHKVPAAFRASDRAAAEWFEIMQALRHEARCARTGDEMPTEYVVLLTAVRTEIAVVLAEVRLDTNLSAMQTVFENWSSE